MFHLDDGELLSYMTLSEAYDMLDKASFFYVHQGYIVNFAQIREVKMKVVCLGKNREIPISRKYQPKMRQMHLDKIMRLRAEKYQG